MLPVSHHSIVDGATYLYKLSNSTSVHKAHIHEYLTRSMTLLGPIVDIIVKCC
jgi:hypothetical protein